MDWIKKHYDQFSLAVISAIVLALAIFLYLKAHSFGERFTDSLAAVAENNKVPPVVLDQIDKANALLAKPPVWVAALPDRPDSDRGSLFVSEHYMLNKEGNPTRPASGSIYTDSLTGQPIPNIWFLDHNLPLFDPTVPVQDPDGDGFTNETEWRLHTDPNSKESHPPYYEVLFLRAVLRKPFHLKFSSYDGDLKKDPTGATFEYSINTIDLRQPTEFLKIGDNIPKTTYKLEKFQYKTARNPSTDEMDDVSELTVVNTETGDRAVLILNRIVDSPDFYVQFDYEWPTPPQPPLHPVEFVVKKAGKFLLRPNVNPATDSYKLIDIKDDTAVIQLPDGQKSANGDTTVVIKRDPRRK
jgi:hypothetical protein